MRKLTPEISNPLHRAVIDGVLAVAVLSLSVVTMVGVTVGLPRPVFYSAVIGLVFVAVGGLVGRLTTRSDHIKAQQSLHTLRIAEESLSDLRKGLNLESALAVCRIALEESEAAAVAITDRQVVLGFAGIGADHHRAGEPVQTKATREAIDEGVLRILASKEEIGCPESTCLLRAAIVVPLEMRGKACGSLKFYYTTPRLLNETQVTMVRGLARLLSTQLELSELDRQTELARDMELKALQSQINPHFLFNTINTIAMLIRTDPFKARDLLREFASFYRRTLEESEDLVTFERELEYVHTYLVFERARFGARLQIREEIDPEVLALELPAFILQPLVENSVQHGARPDGAIHVVLRARRDGHNYCIEVEDDGVGIEAAALPRVLDQGYGSGLGIALRNVHDRLRGYFEEGSGLTIESTEGQGTLVRITIVPHRPAPPGAAGPGSEE